MNKFLAFGATVATLAMSSGLVFADPVTSPGDTDIEAEYTVDSSYSVEIPANITFTGYDNLQTKIVSASNVLIEKDKFLSVSLSSRNGMLKNTDSSTISYSIEYEADSSIISEDIVKDKTYNILSIIPGNVDGASTSINFTSGNGNSVTLAGHHSDTLTFSVSLQDYDLDQEQSDPEPKTITIKGIEVDVVQNIASLDFEKSFSFSGFETEPVIVNANKNSILSFGSPNNTGRAVGKSVVEVSGGDIISLSSYKLSDNKDAFFALAEFDENGNYVSGGQTWKQWNSEDVILQDDTRYIWFGYKIADNTIEITDEYISELVGMTIITSSKQSDPTSSTFYLSSTLGGMQKKASAKLTTNIVTDESEGLTCSSSNTNIATCSIIGKELVVEPSTTAGNTQITVNDRNGNNATYDATFISEIQDNWYIHVSFDDVEISVKNLAKGTYDSVYDEPFFGWLKSLHDQYGAKFSLYVYGGSTNNVSNKYASELSAASSWLKFGLHNPGSGVQFTNKTYDEAKNAWDSFVANIFRMTGTYDSIDHMPRLDYFYGNKNALLGLRDADQGTVGYLSSDDSRISYYFSQSQATYMYTHDHIKDTENNFTFLRTDFRTDWFLPSFSSANNYQKPVKSSVYKELEYRYYTTTFTNELPSFIAFGHEWQYYNGSTLNSYANAHFGELCRFAYDYGIPFDYPQNHEYAATEYDF